MKQLRTNEIDEKKHYGFHFTSRNNEDSFDRSGLEPRIGENSSGGLGKEAIEKVFFSHNVKGMLMTFNRLVNASFEARIDDLMNDQYYKHFPESITSLIPEEIRQEIHEAQSEYSAKVQEVSARGLTGEERIEFIKDTKRKLDVCFSKATSSLSEQGIEKLTCTQGFELVESFMKDNMYLVFEITPSTYENEVTENDIDRANGIVENNHELKKIMDRINELDELNDNDSINRKTKKEYAEERRSCSKLIRKAIGAELDKTRGRRISQGDFDFVDYNEEHCRFDFQNENNFHTAIVTDERTGDVTGVGISPERLRMITPDGKATDGISVVRDLINRRDKSEPYMMITKKAVDPAMIEIFLAYVSMPEVARQSQSEFLNEEIHKYYKINREVLNARRKGLTVNEEQLKSPYYYESGILKITESMRMLSRENPEFSSGLLEGIKRISEGRLARNVEDASKEIRTEIQGRDKDEMGNIKED